VSAAGGVDDSFPVVLGVEPVVLGVEPAVLGVEPARLDGVDRSLKESLCTGEKIVKSKKGLER